ncbi:hypothetical protein, partial [Bradyrhizobium uaiense]|nr:hypothetical protein [Bradyrhizobium uaiense]
RTPRRAAASIALHARPVPHQREVAALRAHLAFVALGLRFGATARGVSDTIEGAVALKQEVSHDLSPTEKLEALQTWSKPGT